MNQDGRQDEDRYDVETNTRGMERIAFAAATAAGGVGFLGWIIFVGGFSVWSRANQTGIPEVEAVAVTSREVLIAEGLEFAAPALAAAVMVSVFCYAWTLKTTEDAVDRERKRLTKELQVQGDWLESAQAEELPEHIVRAQARIKSLKERLAELDRIEAGRPNRRQAEPENVPRKRDTRYRVLVTLIVLSSVAAALWLVGTELPTPGVVFVTLGVYGGLILILDYLEGYQRERLQKLAKKPFWSRWKGVPGKLASRSHDPEIWLDRARRLVLLLTVLALLVVALTVSHAGPAVRMSFAAVVLIALVTFLLHHAPTLYSIIAVFLGLTVIWGLTRYLSVHEDPRVEPAAVLRSGEGPLCGFFIARDSDHLYLGTFERHVSTDQSELARTCSDLAPEDLQTDAADERITPRMISLPIAELTDIAIGSEQDFPRRAEVEASKLALDLCERELARPAANEVDSCAPEDLRPLRVLAGSPTECDAFNSQAAAQKHLLRQDRDPHELGLDDDENPDVACAASPAPYRGELTLDVEKSNFIGRLDDVDTCADDRVVKLVRLVKGESPEHVDGSPLEGDGTYSIPVDGRRGRFRAILPKREDDCLRDESTPEQIRQTSPRKGGGGAASTP